MKKKFLIVAVLFCAICLVLAQVACISGNDGNKDGNKPGGDSSGDVSGNAEIRVESVAFAEKSTTLESGGEYTLDYTVTPAGGEVDFEMTDGVVFEYQVVSEGTVKIKALSAGSGKLQIKAKSDGSISDECVIKVNVPKGYKAYENNTNGVKLVYPSDWTLVSAPMAMVSYKSSDTTSNFNLMKQNRTTAHLNASSEEFENAIKSTYSQMGIKVNFKTCTTNKYDSNKALKVVMEYTIVNGLASVDIYQEQYIINSKNATFMLTLTLDKDDMDKGIAETMIKEFVAW